MTARHPKLFTASLYALAAAGVMVLYFPVLDHYFIPEDFWSLGIPMLHGFSWKSFLIPHNPHFTPFFRFLFAIQYTWFGYHPQPYYLVSIMLHTANSLLAILFFSRLWQNRKLGFTAGILFAFSAVYWRVPMQIALQLNLWSAFWFLWAGLCFLSFLRRPRAQTLLAAVFFHFLMILTYSAGLEIPLLYLSLFLLLRKETPFAGRSPAFGLGLILPFILTDITYFALRENLLPADYSVLRWTGDFSQMASQIPQAFKSMFYGFYLNHLHAFTGALAVEEKLRAFYLAGAGFLLLLGLDYRKEGIRKYGGWLGVMTFWVFVMVFAPALVRASFYDTEWFATRSRYLYLPALPAAALFTLIFRSLRPFTKSKSSRLFKITAAMILLFVLGGNISTLRTLMHSNRHLAETRFREIESVFIRDLRLKSEETDSWIQVIDSNALDDGSLCNQPFGCAGGWLRPSLLVRAHLNGSELARIRFLEPKEAVYRNPGYPAYQIQADGHLSVFPGNTNRLSRPVNRLSLLRPAFADSGR